MVDDGFSDNSIGGWIRGIALWVMIITVSLCDAALWWRFAVCPLPIIKFCIAVWAVFWAQIIIVVIGFEIYGKFFSPVRLTISNMYRDWIVYEKQNKLFPWGRVTLIGLELAFTALIVHLWFF